MKKLPLLLCLSFCLIFSKAFSQDFLGLSTGNYSGVTGVMFQPASIVDSRYKFDINLFSTDVNYSNNYFLLDRDVILKFNKNKFDDYNTFKARYLSEASLAPGEKVFFNINNRTQLPLSFMATTGKKSAIALNLQFRTMIQGRNIPQNFADLAFNNFYPSTGNPSVDASGISINSLSWAEAGLTYGRVIYSSGNHYLKMAITGKYLAGLSSISLSSDALQMQVNSDSTFNFNSPNVNYNHSSHADFNKLFNRDLSSNATSFGFDAGLVYEYRGNLDKFKYIKSNDEKSYDALRRDVSKYIFRVGVSLLDVGMFQFDKPADVNSFSANINNWDIKNAHYNSLKEFDTALAARVIANPNDLRSYKVYLPSALSVQLDVKFVKGLFLNIMSYWPVSLGNSEGKRFNNYGFYSITPRYETRHFGIYIPYTVVQQNDFTNYKENLLGLTLRGGPFFIGSSNLGSMLFKRNLRTADVHLGFKIGFTYGKPNKSNKLLSKFFAKNQEVEYNQPNEPKVDYSVRPGNVEPQSKNEKAITKQSDSRGLILDYKTQKVYDNPDVKQNLIVINNYYYYGNTPPQTKSDTITVQNDFPIYNADSLRANALEMATQQNKRIADSIYKVTKDSLEVKRTQLDSLINTMQQLKKQMDRSSKIMDSINNDQTFNNPPTATENLKATNSTVLNDQDSLQKSGTSGSRVDTVSNRLSASAPVMKSTNKPDDTLQNANDSFQRSELIINRMDTTQKDIATANLNRQDNRKSADIKKKDSLVINTNGTQNKKDVALITRKENTIEPDKTQNTPIVRNAESTQDMQEEQNQLYQKYAAESARLGNDIDRLNKRLSLTEQTRRPNANYVPVPLGVPYNNSRNFDKEAPPVVAPVKITDTVYIRDTVTIYSKDTVKNILPDTVQQIIKIRETKTDTIKVKEPAKQPHFNYAEMPEDHILFGIGKSAVQPNYDTRLNYIADVLKKNPDLQVIVTGHTDATGSKAINEKLSLQRAEAVSYFLMKKGVPAKQIIVKSLASEEPAVSGSNQTARSQNRRVALKLKEINN